MEMQTSRFLVKAMDRNLDTGSSGAQRVLFEATPLETTTSTSTITAPSVGGYRITDRIETSLVEGELNQDLRLVTDSFTFASRIIQLPLSFKRAFLSQL